MTAKRISHSPSNQEVCIDLPGETVQCWRSNDNIRVTLRKHRDVIFDINLASGRTYSVESTGSDLYNSRDKKLIRGNNAGVVTFKDGEKLHLWIARNFKGALLLKCGTILLMRILPDEFDERQYDGKPRTKPAPIIVALGHVSPYSTSAGTAAPSPSAKVAMPAPAAAPVDEEVSLVCVVEGTASEMPAILTSHFSSGGGKSGFADIDPFEVATRNWLWGQAAGSAAYVKDNWTWLRASLDRKVANGFRLVSVKAHRVGGKVRFYFSGYSKYNSVFGPGGFNPGNERIMSIFSGAGKASTTLTGAAKGAAASFKGFALVSFIFGSATAIAEWKADVSKDGYDLAASLCVTVLKTLLGAALTALVIALIIAGLTLMVGGSVLVVAVGALTIAAGIGANYLVDALDKYAGKSITGDQKNSDGIAAPLSAALRKAGKMIQHNWDELAKLGPDYLGSPL